MSERLHIASLGVTLGGHRVLDGVELNLDAGAYGVVLGPSGAGKSTMLRAIAGLVDASGTIAIGDSVVLGPGLCVPPEARGVGYLFQGLALWPHMTVEGHLRYSLKGARVPVAEQANRIRETLEPLGIADLAERRPSELSGGERQRLALARALVARPRLVLLDEPTSSVDPATAADVQDLLADLNRNFGSTILHVTHDQREALALADTVFVMDDGAILQAGSPDDVYERPASATVARFIGAGGLLPATLVGDGEADTPLGHVHVDPAGLAGAVWLLLRPQHLGVAPVGEGVPAQVSRVRYRGGRYAVRVTVGEWPLELRLDERPAMDQPLRIRVVRPPRAVAIRRDS